MYCFKMWLHKFVWQDKRDVLVIGWIWIIERKREILILTHTFINPVSVTRKPAMSHYHINNQHRKWLKTRSTSKHSLEKHHCNAKTSKTCISLYKISWNPRLNKSLKHYLGTLSWPCKFLILFFIELYIAIFICPTIKLINYHLNLWYNLPHK